MKYIYKLFFLIIIMVVSDCFVCSFTNEKINDASKSYLVRINKFGWNLPKMEYYKKVFSGKESYIPCKSPTNVQANDLDVQKRYFLRECFDFNVENNRYYFQDHFLYYYQEDSFQIKQLRDIEKLAIYKVPSLCILKTIDGSNIICYDLQLMTRCKKASDFLGMALQSKKENHVDQFRDMAHAPSSSDFFNIYVFDRDNDGVFESIIMGELPSEESKTVDFILSIKSEFNKNKNENKVTLNKIKMLKKAWIDYFWLPSKKNAYRVLKLLPNEYIDPSGIEFHPIFELYERMGKDKKKFLKNIDLLSKEEKQLWLMVKDNLYILEKELYAGEEISTNIVFRLYKIFYNSCLFKGQLERIIDEFVRIKPRLFLIALRKKSGKEFELANLLDGFFGYEYINLAQVKLLKINQKIEALKTVSDPELNKVKNLCITQLIKERDNINKKFYIPKLSD